MFIPGHGSHRGEKGGTFSSAPSDVLSLKPLVRPFCPDDDGMLTRPARQRLQPPHRQEQHARAMPGIFKSLDSVDTFSIDSSCGVDPTVGGGDDWMDIAEDNVGGEGGLLIRLEASFDQKVGEFPISDVTTQSTDTIGHQSNIQTVPSFNLDDYPFTDQLFDDAMSGLVDMGKTTNGSGRAQLGGGGDIAINGSRPSSVASASRPVAFSFASRFVDDDNEEKMVNVVSQGKTTPASSPVSKLGHNRSRKVLIAESIVTPDETPLLVATLEGPPFKEAGDTVNSKSQLGKPTYLGETQMKQISKLDCASHRRLQLDLALSEEGPFPQEMKPILKILLYLDETCQDHSKVRRGFEVVQLCCRKYQQNQTSGDAEDKATMTKFHELSGEIFEELINVVGEDLLGELILSSQSYESPRLDMLVSSGVGMLDFDSVRCKDTSLTTCGAAGTPLDSSTPGSIELAVAYGAHYARLHPSAPVAEMARKGSRMVETMSKAERKELWAMLVDMPLP